MTRITTLTLSAMLSLGALVAGLLAWVKISTYQPDVIEQAALSCSANAPELPTKTEFSVVSYNTQFFAGKRYVFYFDLPDNAGPHLHPRMADVNLTLDAIASELTHLDSDFVLLQEVHDGASATGGVNQTDELLKRLPQGLYPCVAEAFYWQADFIPHPKILGSVGMKLVTLSKYKLDTAQRHQLPQPPMDWLSQQFYLKRALLETRVAGDAKLTLINTHFDAFAQGSDTMARQVQQTVTRLQQLDNDDQHWILGGDLNLLMPGMKAGLKTSQHYLYANNSEIVPLLQWPSIPEPEQVAANPAKWATHLPNDPDVSEADRSIDYLFYSHSLVPQQSAILNHGAFLNLSDHFPVTASFRHK